MVEHRLPVRYADTDGFQADPTREMWPWRDWLVDQLNANTPFDQLTREMLAGDLLPDATPEQRLGSGFNRNHMTNGEGGRDPEESRIDYVIDRVNTMGTVWLGLTLGCCQCHSHKYDPITQTEYYQLLAFFNSTAESPLDGNKYDYKPVIKAPANQQAWSAWLELEAQRDRVPDDSSRDRFAELVAEVLRETLAALPTPAAR